MRSGARLAALVAAESEVAAIDELLEERIGEAGALPNSGAADGHDRAGCAPCCSNTLLRGSLTGARGGGGEL